MTVRVEMRYEDDLGSAGKAEPVRFSVEGVDYEIHLNKRNRETFLRRMGVYVAAAHKPVDSTSSRLRNPDAPAIRAWAANQGVTLAERGRIPQNIVEAFYASR